MHDLAALAHKMGLVQSRWEWAEKISLNPRRFHQIDNGQVYTVDQIHEAVKLVGMPHGYVFGEGKRLPGLTAHKEAMLSRNTNYRKRTTDKD
jgi:hypothetical protein